MIRFDKIWIEGFGSIVDEQKFKLNRPGLNIIIAENGAGKTTIFNAVYWTLYGQSLKEIKSLIPWEEIQTETYQGTKNRVKFVNDITGDKYEVIRCKDYKGKVEGHKGKDRLLLYKNGEYQTQYRDKNPTQEAIISILGYSAGLFKNSIIFGQRLKRLIQETGPNKKKIFEEAFDAAFIKEGRDRASDKYKSTNSEFVEVSVRYALTKANLKQTKENLVQLKTQKEKLQTQQTKRLDELNNELEAEQKKFAICQIIIHPTFIEGQLNTKREELGALSKLEQEIEALEKREFRETNLQDDLEHRLGLLDNEVSLARSSFKNLIRNCPRCGQKLDKQKIKSEKTKLQLGITNIKSLRKELNAKLGEQQGIVKGLLDEISSKKADKLKIDELRKNIKTLELQLSSARKQAQQRSLSEQVIDSYRRQINLLKKQTIDINLKPLIKAKRSLKADKKEIKPLYKRLKKEVKDLKWAMDEVLGNKGLKAYIFESRLKELNQRLKYYEQFIGYRVEFKVDLDSTNKDIFALAHKGNYQHFYEELSGAQQQLCDIVTAFALHDLITVGKPLNFLVFDEVLDGLTETNVDIVNELIRQKAYDKSIFLITHNIDLQSSSDKVISLHLNAAGRTILKTLS